MRGVLVDTSVWIDHFRQRNTELIHLLGDDRVMTHPLVVGEIACGSPPRRNQTLTDLQLLQQTRQATVDEAIAWIEREGLFATGCGLIDILLLASTLMTPGMVLWTLDRRLSALAGRYGVLHQPALR